MAEYQFHLPDMSCGHCVATITAAVQQLDPLATLQVEREARQVRIGSQALSRQAFSDALTEAGYPPAEAA